MTATDKATPRPLDAAQIDHMVSRFLQWKLPKDFNPDGGISFIADKYPGHKYEPVGTNLFDAEQTKAMVLHMVEGLPVALPAPAGAVTDEMRSLDETLAALEGKHGNGWINITMKERRVFAKLLRERIAALDAQAGAGTVSASAVKPLKWVRADGSLISKGYGIVDYEITPFDLLFIGGKPVEKFWGDREAAKAAAQADFDKRVKLALIESPSTSTAGDEVQGMVERVIAEAKRRYSTPSNLEDYPRDAENWTDGGLIKLLLTERVQLSEQITALTAERDETNEAHAQLIEIAHAEAEASREQIAALTAERNEFRESNSLKGKAFAKASAELAASRALLAEAEKRNVILDAQLADMEFLSIKGFLDWQREFRRARELVTKLKSGGK